MNKCSSLLTAGFLLTVLTACGEAGESEGSGDTGSEEAESNSDEIVIEHDLGETSLEVNPETVVSFDNGVTDSIRAIGGNISGIPMADVVPEYLSEFESDDYEDVGSLFEPNFELINEMQPDVIFISGRTSDHYEELSEIAPTVFLAVDTENYMESFEENMYTLGEIFAAEDEVESQLDDIYAVIDDVSTHAEESGENGLILTADEGSASAYGAGSRFGIIHDVLEVETADPGINAETHGETVSFEYIADVNPDYLFVLDRGATIGNEATAGAVIDNDLVARTNAHQNDNIVTMNGDVWYLSGGGLESVRLMVEEIAEQYVD